VKTQRSADIAAGCVLAVLGLVTLYASTMIKGGMEERLPPRTLPYTVGLLVLVCGIGLAVRSWRYRGEDPLIKWPDGEGRRTIVVTLLSLAIYIGLMDPLGLPLSTFLYVAFSIWYLKRTKWWQALVIGLISGAVSYYLFIYLLELSFPVGFFLGG
jgi:putative tricarboxylic transport membrane protein